MLDSVAYFAYISHLNSLANLKALVGKMKIRFYFCASLESAIFPTNATKIQRNNLLPVNENSVLLCILEIVYLND